MANENAEADFAILVTGLARVVADRLGAAVARAGIDDMRTSFGFVIRALTQRGRTLTELADLLGVTKQAAIKVVDEMERRGFLERIPDPVDRRTKVIELTEKARRARKAAMAESRRIERELRADLGEPAVTTMRQAMVHLLERHDALEDASAGRSRAPW